MNNFVVNGANVFHYAYNYTDHLGNIRLTYGVDPVTGVLKIMEENHYYPYGMKHANYNSGGNAFQKVNLDIALKAAAAPSDPGNGGDLSVSAYKYKYNGKEYQDELGLNMYDMDMRQYDPAIARWVALDPVVHHDLSPYNAFDNNPVFWADPSGADSQSGMTDSNGSSRFDIFGLYVNPLDRSNNGDPFFDINRDREKNATSKKKSDEGKDTDPPKKTKDEKTAVWDTNGDGKLQKGEADSWYLNGNGVTIIVDNSLIDWKGLEMPLKTKINSEFTIQTHDAFFDLPSETSSTYGGTPFVRTGLRTAIIKDQEYHYRLRPNDSFKNFFRNILNEFGKPGGSYYGQGYNNHYSPPAGQPYTIHFINPKIRFK